MFVVFDLDGTLANGKHREHYITGEGKKDWDAFFLASGGDLPIPHAIATLQAFYKAGAGHRIEIWSGRGEGDEGAVRRITSEWLIEHVHPEIYPYGKVQPYRRLRMRGHRDYTPDDELKLRWLNEAREAGDPPDLVFDDRQRVVDMWRREGVPCFHVAPGDF